LKNPSSKNQDRITGLPAGWWNDPGGKEMPLDRILIVEHQHEVSRLLRSALETLEAELEVVEIPSGEEAILYSSRNTVDLLVSDFRLPGISGVELMHKVKKNHPQARIILVTGQPDPRIRKEVAEAGADAFFIKPVPMADFLNAVERLLGLVETNLPPEPMTIEGTEVQPGFGDLLAGLRKDLAATAVLLINETGRILARAGALPERDNEVTLISSLLSIHTAGQKVSRLLGQKHTMDRYVYDGGEYDLVFAPVGSSEAMLVIGKGIAGQDQSSRTIEIFSVARMNIGQLIGGPAINSLNTSVPPTTPSEEVEQFVEKIEPLLKKVKKKNKTGELDDFWNKAADQHVAPAEADMLSYEQARKLGLAPGDES
jgi:two-component system chemotaxis response regulator CheY